MMLEDYLLPMARWLVMVAIALEVFRNFTTAFTVMRHKDSHWRAILQELRGSIFLLGIMGFYITSLITHPSADATRMEIVLLNALYAGYFLMLTGGHKHVWERRCPDCEASLDPKRRNQHRW